MGREAWLRLLPFPEWGYLCGRVLCGQNARLRGLSIRKWAQIRRLLARRSEARTGHLHLQKRRDSCRPLASWSLGDSQLPEPCPGLSDRRLPLEGPECRPGIKAGSCQSHGCFAGGGQSEQSSSLCQSCCERSSSSCRKGCTETQRFSTLCGYCVISLLQAANFVTNRVSYGKYLQEY